ncbi:tRNA (guanosine(37)-N1)-methyltransferase TrmD [Rothia kristinae]|uniref:tRNA (guanosine(37)-N1)-methyltransferase TrmD n=1 Tax=Rothia kristinae TaxID=37923 RepID=UPI00344513BC
MRHRYDVVSIFTEYLAPLELSLIGKARRAGLLDLRVHDLREHTHDRHRTVDDTPYGGGAGMVMKPEPWAEALEAILDEPADSTEPAQPDPRPLLIVPSPAGEVFTQRTAEAWAQEEHLVFACGRYEGIDERVLEWAAERFRVRPVSIGDYVLNGGEVAVMAMIEAVARLLPGVIGNPASLVEESHAEGLLEYPVYTKPADWRGREVPQVLLTGNHALIARTRRDWQLRRTLERRPDLIQALPPQRLDARDRTVLEEAARDTGSEGADPLG